MRQKKRHSLIEDERIPDMLRRIGGEEITHEGMVGSRLEAVMRRVYEAALSGRSWAVNFITDRTEGKVSEKIEQTLVEFSSDLGGDDGIDIDIDAIREEYALGEE